MRLTTLIFLLAGPLCMVTATFARADTEALARRLLNSQGCKACHRIERVGAATATDLEKIGSRLTREQLRVKLTNPQKLHAAGRIADFSHLQGVEIDALVDFLSRQR